MQYARVIVSSCMLLSLFCEIYNYPYSHESSLLPRVNFHHPIKKGPLRKALPVRTIMMMIVMMTMTMTIITMVVMMMMLC